MRIAKVTALTIVCCFFLGSFTAAFGADVAKIGVFDFQKFIKNSKAGKDAQRKVTKQGKAMEQDFKKRQAELEQLRKRLEQEALVMTKQKRDEKEREYRIKLMDFKDIQKKYTSDIKELQAKLINNIRKDVMKILQEIGKKEGYLLIVENIGVLYYPNQIDITDKLIKAHDAVYVSAQP